MTTTPNTTAGLGQAVVPPIHPEQAASTMRTPLDIESSMVLPFSQPSGDNQHWETQSHGPLMSSKVHHEIQTGASAGHSSLYAHPFGIAASSFSPEGALN